MLCHASVGKGFSGFIAVDEDGDLVEYAGWKDDYLTSFEVAEKYRRQGYGELFLKKAISEGVRKLSVFHSNMRAQKLYEKLGFKENKRNGKMIFMELPY